MTIYRTPGVYVEEKSTLPSSVAEVATAVPAFIGYTRNGPADTAEPSVARIATLLEFDTAFGAAQPAKFDVTELADSADAVAVELTPPTHPFSLYYALSLYFRNGGGPCYVVSVGNYASTPSFAHFTKGLAALEKEDEPTLIVLTDAACVLEAGDYYDVCGQALAQCEKLGDRFTILDVIDGEVEDFRNDRNLSANLKYGAAYHPYLKTSINHDYVETGVTFVLPHGKGTHKLGIDADKGIAVSFTGPTGSTPKVAVTAAGLALTFSITDGTLTIAGAKDKTGNEIADAWSTWKKSNPALGFDIVSSGDGSGVVATNDLASALIAVTDETLASIMSTQTALYNKTKAALAEQRVVLPPSSAVAGIYARVDREQGVWKAPANVGVLAVLGPVTRITDAQQDNLNVDATAGKSINAIRSFTGKGTLVWGARTLAGNDNEWRYVPVRRLFLVIEESVKKASAFAVFEPNDQTTWLKVRAMIESYLYGLWQQGALAGSKPEAAYYVRVGLGTTMTPQHVLEGQMIVETGVAAVRPAEFIILRFSHKMQTA
ncbi:phage tail sheath C-terminal domain-containing protein [Accumulibacter sp.]|uniref:phage tail sheath family protein n=1 Tax=Accumulibacter sp. TaxID=2053492 RepID=UPI001ACADC26|nr:phage tail sheath C-terminal domain-containing protein [Accumulibacter sp.]MBN8452074.1 phage tail sheath family protein [Accumulibacter sp.]